MHTSFLSKLTRITTTHHRLVALNSNYKHSYARHQTKNLSGFASSSPMPNRFCSCSTQFHFPCLSRYLSSISSSSSSGSDDGKKHQNPPDGPPISFKSNEEESLKHDSNINLPPPACAVLNDYVTRPVVEHEVGLEASRRGRSKAPATKPNSSPQKEHPRPKKDKSKTKPSREPPPGKTSPSPSRKRAKDRLEVLTKQDCDRRLVFAYKLLLLIEDEPDILDHILWTDECNFNLPKLASLINKPPVAESELLPQIAWCGISTKGTVGPYFFNSHVTDKTYIKMLETYVLPELESKGYNLKELWFQQDGAPWHRSKSVIDFLKSVFDYRLISLGTKFIWPPRSQDLTPMDYFFWDYMKVKLDFKHSKYDLCFQQSFREILSREVNTASVNALQGAIYQLPERLEMCLNENGGRFVHLLYPDRYEKDGTRKARKQQGEKVKPNQAIQNMADCAIPLLTKDKSNFQIPSTKSNPLPPTTATNTDSSTNPNANTP